MTHARRELSLTSREVAALDAHIAANTGVDLPEQIVRAKVVEALVAVGALSVENHAVAEVLIWLRMRRLRVLSDLVGAVQRVHAWHEMQGSTTPAIEVLATELRATNPDIGEADIALAITGYQGYQTYLKR